MSSRWKGMDSILRTISDIHKDLETAGKTSCLVLSRKEYALTDVDSALSTMKKKIQERNLEIHKRSDEYLQRFLVSRALDVECAIKLAVNYENFIKHTSNPLRIAWNDVEELLLSSTFNVLEIMERQRRVVWLRPGRWNTEKLPIERAFHAGIVAAEPLSLEPEIQTTGVIVLVDFKNLTSKQLKPITKSFIKKLYYFLSECVPLRIESIHLLNAPALLSVVLSIFLGVFKGKVEHQVHLHGRGIKGIEKFVSKTVLPVQLGGTYNHSPEIWLNKMRSASVEKALRNLGYVTNPETESAAVGN